MSLWGQKADNGVLAMLTVGHSWMLPFMTYHLEFLHHLSALIHNDNNSICSTVVLKGAVSPPAVFTVTAPWRN